MNKKNEMGNRYGRWTVIKDAGNNAKGQGIWLCQCVCGTIKPVLGLSLRSGNSQSCGCLANEKTIIRNGVKAIDETGKRYGRLTVVGRVSSTSKGVYWRCKCDCGNETITRGATLRSGGSNSFGCYGRERTRECNSGDRNHMKMKTRENHPGWKGGKHIFRGYVMILCGNGYIPEHILVMQKMLGGPIPEGAVVHHCNRNRADNRPYNLRLFLSSGEHTAYHHKIRRGTANTGKSPC